MRRWNKNVAGAAAAMGIVLAAVAFAHAETCTLELKRLNAEGRNEYTSWATEGYLSEAGNQGFFVQIGGDAKSRLELPGTAEQAAAFKRIVKKEPKYESPHPFRGVAKLGSQEYAFALDLVASKPKEEKPKAKTEAQPESATIRLLQSLFASSEAESSTEEAGYNRLYFDFNRNGDLTDDRVVAADHSQGNAGWANFSFPRVDVTIDSGGTKLDYAFRLDGYVYGSGDVGYATVSLRGAVYREGDITLNGKKHHVVLLDANSNGRFDDETKFVADPQSPSRQLNPQRGDVLLIDPGQERPDYASLRDLTSSPNRLQVSKLVGIDGRFYNLKVSPAGDTLTLDSSSVKLGNITNPNDGFRATIYSDQCVATIGGNKGEPTPVPEGQWKLANYTIDQTVRQREKKKKEEPEPGALLGQAIARVFTPWAAIAGDTFSSQETIVTAEATAACQPVTVRAGETVTMPFGPPYTPTVTAGPTGEKGQVRLSLSLVGSAGEVCTRLIVDGGRPEKPSFTITDDKDKVVESGNFEYG